MVVKSKYAAERINERLKDFKGYVVDHTDERTWKYYLNMAGEYHPTDTVMYVASSDTAEQIVFDKDTLITHRKTYRDYQIGSRQYEELLLKYPDQEDLILGILHPVDIEEAITAPDHKILSAKPGLIEANEYSLIEELQEWTNVYFKRYYNDQYTITDSLYYGVVLSMYFMNLVPAVLTARLKRHKTVEAHSFYVSQYLASNSNLGDIHPFMNLDQALHFYRNIKYYQRHAGSNDTLAMITDALLTKRHMPLSSYTMRHDVEDQSFNIYPEITFKRDDMTRIATMSGTELINSRTLLDKEVPTAPNNLATLEVEEPFIIQKLKDSSTNVLQTKVLESQVVDYEKTTTYKLEDIQIAHWLYYSHLNLYRSVVPITLPITGETLVLPVKDAYILASYAVLKSHDYEIGEVPLFGANRVQRQPFPSDADLMSIVEMKRVDDFTWKTIMDSRVYVLPMISADAFYETTRELFIAANFQREIVSYQEGMHERSEVYKLITRMYADEYIRLVPKGMLYNQWLIENNLFFDDYTKEDFRALFDSIVSTAIGANLDNTPSLRNIHEAMLKAMGMLNSYTIQFVGHMSDEKTTMMNLPSVRGGEQEISVEGLKRIHMGYYDLFRQDVHATHSNNLQMNIFTDLISRNVDASTYHWIDLQNGPRIPDRGVIHDHKVLLSRIEFGVVDKPDVGNTGLQPVLGMNHFIGLDKQQRAGLFD